MIDHEPLLARVSCLQSLRVPWFQQVESGTEKVQNIVHNVKEHYKFHTELQFTTLLDT